MKNTRRVISIILCIVMTLTTFCGVGVLPTVTADAADGQSINGVTQKRVVGTDGSYALTYAEYAADYLNGASEPTDIIVPGMDPSEDYVLQGMSYWPAKDWILLTVYHADGDQTSKVFAIDAATGNFRAWFDFKNVDGTTMNYDHGGGIAVSDYNFYYSCDDDDRKIAYAPISAFDLKASETYKTIQLVDERDFAEIGSVDKDDKTAYSAYVCFDQGILWTGNFYDKGTSVAGVGIADGYNAPATSTYNSMVWGYKLSGSSSEEEWANLTSTTAGKNCQGSPSYAIALNNNIKDVQYATVDNGKLYMSSSYGSGAGNSITFGFGETSKLTIADIDLTIPGTGSVDIRLGDGSSKTLSGVYVIDDYKQYDMMPMSEGLCVIDDYVYITFESSSNKYLNESSGITSIGNCTKPVDVVWRLDQYELMGQTRENEENTLQYEKVSKLSDIKDGEQYIIVHESAEKDSFTQKNWLYAFDSFGGYKGNKVSKLSNTNPAGYEGMIGYPIIDYSLDGNKLYLTNPSVDDQPNIHWTITGANSGKLRIQNDDTFFSSFRNLYADKEKIALAADDVTGLDNMKLIEAPDSDGGFYLQGTDGSRVWCNDGVTGTDSGKSYTDLANEFYANSSSIEMYDGVKEQKGTFHPDALNINPSGNVIGTSIATRNNYEDAVFYIYRRVIDEYTSTKDSNIYTDMDAELQADGTYTVTLETYATGEMQYQVLDDTRPTDYVFLLDASASMNTNSDCSGYNKTVAKMTAHNVTDDGSGDLYKDGGTKSCGEIFVRYKDAMRVTTVEVSERGNNGSWISPKYYNYMWLSIDVDGTTYWWTPNSTTDASQGGSWSTTKPAESATMYVQKNDTDGRADAALYQGEFYRYNQSSDTTRYCAMKTSFDVLSKEIQSKEPDARIALVQFGSDNNENWDNMGMYTNNSTTMVQYSGVDSISADTYAKAFYTADNFEKCRDIVWAMDMPNSPDTYINYGLDMVQNIAKAAGDEYYTAGGERNLAVVIVTDGIPGLGTEDMSIANLCAEYGVNIAHNVKGLGGSIYTVQMGNASTDDFSMNLYLNAVSSNYPNAKSRTDLGLKNPNGIDYTIDVELGSETVFQTMADKVYAAVQKNAKYALTHLDDESILRATLSKAFIVPADFSGSIKATLVPGNYDVCGRLTWGTPVKATGVQTVTAGTNSQMAADTLVVTGYNYSDNYIARKHSGNKLVITITGLCANPNEVIENTSINDPAKTAIYQDKTFTMGGLAVKSFPTKYFTIPVYDYNLDFGLSVQNSTGTTGAKFLAVSETLGKQDPDNYLQVSKTGKMELLNDTTFVGHIDPGTFDENGYILWQTSTGIYEWLGINLNPASNILYEEDILKDKSSSTGVSWVTDGTKLKDYQETPGVSDVYGYDSAYAENTAHSNGTAYSASVSSENRKTVTKSFTFTGESFDLISACGENTGMLLVTIKKQDGTRVAAYVVDTYYRDAANLADNGLLCQTPVLKFSGDYGTYTVEVTGAYLSSAGALQPATAVQSVAMGALTGYTTEQSGAPIDVMLEEIGMEEMFDYDDVQFIFFDENSVLNGGTSAYTVAENDANAGGIQSSSAAISLNCYLDGVRVYNSLQDTSAYVWSEQQPAYYNVIDNLASGTFTSDSVINGFAFVESPGAGNEVNFANYQQNGPQNEFYLNKATDGTSALAFKVRCKGSDTRVMVALRSVSGKPVDVQVGSLEFTVSSPTEMYYDITDAIVIGTDNYATVTIKNNTADCALAVNNIKTTEASITSMSFTDQSDIFYVMSAPAQPAVVSANGVVTLAETADDTADDGNSDSDTGSTGIDIIDMIISIIKQIFESIMQFLPMGEVK